MHFTHSRTSERVIGKLRVRYHNPVILATVNAVIENRSRIGWSGAAFFLGGGGGLEEGVPGFLHLTPGGKAGKSPDTAVRDSVLHHKLPRKKKSGHCNFLIAPAGPAL